MDTITAYHVHDGYFGPAEYEIVTEEDIADEASFITFHVPEIASDVAAVVYDDGAIFTTSDWQGLQPSEDEIDDSIWTWVYYGEGGWSSDVAVVDGLPRLLPFATFKRPLMSSATFRALRETTGISQRLVAEALEIDERSVKRWERGDSPVPNTVAAWMAAQVRAHDEAVEQTVDALVEMVEDIDGDRPPIDLSYYRSQAEYDLEGRDKGDYGIVCARARSIASRLRDLGYEVEFRYPPRH